MVFLFALVFTGTAGYLLFTGPHMLVQENIRAYQAMMPPPPKDSVPLDRAEELPSQQAAATMSNPLPPTAENVAAGRTYYGYYCLSCHGQLGDGAGPVGQSFIPAPGKLRSAGVRAMSDGQLLLASLTGAYHSPAVPEKNLMPVLQYTVRPQHRWYVVLYVRSLGN